MSSPAIPLDAIGEPVFVFDIEGVVAAANSAADRFAGTAVTGLSADGLADRLALRLADARSAETVRISVQKALEGGEPPPLQGTITAADGSSVGALIVITPICEDFLCSGALSVWHEMTGREQL
jgi:PAS domain-containing protein